MSLKEFLQDEEKIREVARAAFDSVDTDKSGEIDNKELTILMQGISKDLGIEPPSQEEVDEVLKELDTDHSGKIDFNEFVVLIKDVFNSIAESQ